MSAYSGIHTDICILYIRMYRTYKHVYEDRPMRKLQGFKAWGFGVCVFFASFQGSFRKCRR